MDTQTQSKAFVLTDIELYDWGAFSGRHSAQIDTAGTAIIGPTGSGKTTLIDALMTLLTATPRYNLASTGGHESDRDLVSYVRGVSGAGNDTGDNQHIARSGKTVSGIAARFSDGAEELTIGAIFALEDTSSAAADLKRHWIFSQAQGHGLDTWLQVHHDGGTRTLRQLARETSNLTVTPNKQEFLARLRGFFDVGENAFTLLNRAAGVKQLNSIDEIFRELVLDDTAKFDRAAEVAKEFDDLTAIHNELEIARQQQQSLLPIADSWTRRDHLLEELRKHNELRGVLPAWYATIGHRLWGERVTELEGNLTTHTRRGDELALEVDALDAQAQTLRDIYLQAGGASIEQLREQMRTQQALIDRCRRHAGDYCRLVRRFKLQETLTAESLAETQYRARELKSEYDSVLKEQRNQSYEAVAVRHRHQEDVTRLQAELDQARQRTGSNIPPRYQQFRADMSAALGVAEDALPYIAELIEVKAEESHWRGAIERAIGGHRLRILVPSEMIKSALHWINHRDNQLHVRLVEAEIPTTTPQFFDDGFTRKLKFKVHVHREALKQFIAGIDRHCVGSSEELHATPHGLTAKGTMSDRGGRFEKQDQRRLDQDWMTGFDNKDLLASLARQIAEATAELTNSSRQLESAEQRAEATQISLGMLEDLTRVDFNDIDLPAAEATQARLGSRLAALTDPECDVVKAQKQWENADAAVRRLRAVQTQNGIDTEVIRRDRDGAETARQRCHSRIGVGLSDGQQTSADGFFTPPTRENLADLPELERNAAASVQERIDHVSGELGKCQLKLTSQMGAAKRDDTGALAEAGTEMQDVPTYLERLRQLTEEALPEKQQRFLSYLNQSSDQGVTQLLSDIQNEVSTIEEGIEDLNRTLRRVDFQPGRYLRLETRPVVHESLRTLTNAHRHLRSATLKDDQGESHFAALQRVVDLLRDAADRKKTVGARALLDPRYRLEFLVHVIERETGVVIEVRTSSEGGSGGEKEIIASYVLTASLSYALCPDDSERPLFGTIVLDEAFSRSSQAVAARIISALHEFGLHPLFVTPNKELRLLRAHTRSAIVVHRKGQNATLTSVTWEALEEHARQRNPLASSATA